MSSCFSIHNFFFFPLCGVLSLAPASPILNFQRTPVPVTSFLLLPPRGTRPSPHFCVTPPPSFRSLGPCRRLHFKQFGRSFSQIRSGSRERQTTGTFPFLLLRGGWLTLSLFLLTYQVTSVCPFFSLIKPKLDSTRSWPIWLTAFVLSLLFLFKPVARVS